MSQPSIDTAFVEEFESGVHLAYQRMGSKLRNTIRTRDGVKNKTTFQKMGKGSATQKQRHGVIPPMNLPHDNVSVTVEDWYAGEWVDDLDTLRVNHDELMVAQESAAAALGRKTDEIIISDALTTTTSTRDETTNGVTLAFANGLLVDYGNNEVPDDGQRMAVIGWEQWTQLMAIDQFSRSDYVGEDQLPYKGGMTAKRWMTFMWVPFSGLNAGGAADRTECYTYHKNAAAHAIGKDVSSNMQYHNDRASTFVQNQMQMGAVLIDAEGVFKHDLKN